MIVCVSSCSSEVLMHYSGGKRKLKSHQKSPPPPPPFSSIQWMLSLSRRQDEYAQSLLLFQTVSFKSPPWIGTPPKTNFWRRRSRAAAGRTLSFCGGCTWVGCHDTQIRGGLALQPEVTHALPRFLLPLYRKISCRQPWYFNPICSRETFSPGPLLTFHWKERLSIHSTPPRWRRSRTRPRRRSVWGR